jgi:DNA-binding transcriptional MerR regulator
MKAEGDHKSMSAIEQVQIPDKLFYRINEVATITQVKPYVLRYWESEFSMLAPEKDDNDQRRYRKVDIELIVQIKRLLYEEKFTIAGARKQLKELRDQKSEKHQPAAAPIQVDLGRYRRINTSLSDLRQDLTELYRFLA